MPNRFTIKKSTSYTPRAIKGVIPVSQQRIIEYHIARLKDKQVKTRLDAIEQLALLNAEEALPALQEVYEKDLDEEVRKKAQQAGRAIYLNNRKGQTDEQQSSVS